jgi:hypothetical protein
MVTCQNWMSQGIFVAWDQPARVRSDLRDSGPDPVAERLEEKVLE